VAVRGTYASGWQCRLDVRQNQSFIVDSVQRIQWNRDLLYESRSVEALTITTVVRDGYFLFQKLLPFVVTFQIIWNSVQR
jgi:hypothetical protein